MDEGRDVGLGVPDRGQAIRHFEQPHEMDHALTEDLVPNEEQARFLEAVQNLITQQSAPVAMLNIALPPGVLNHAMRDTRGIF